MELKWKTKQKNKEFGLLEGVYRLEVVYFGRGLKIQIGGIYKMLASNQTGRARRLKILGISTGSMPKVYTELEIFWSKSSPPKTQKTRKMAIWAHFRALLIYLTIHGRSLGVY